MFLDFEKKRRPKRRKNVYTCSFRGHLFTPVFNTQLVKVSTGGKSPTSLSIIIFGTLSFPMTQYFLKIAISILVISNQNILPMWLYLQTILPWRCSPIRRLSPVLTQCRQWLPAGTSAIYRPTRSTTPSSTPAQCERLLSGLFKSKFH